ncbi:MAG: hypothetical protein K0R66_569 [Gammaproteobacteria bacterium]|nr:hypothetical protein [Gammaproteobacteria bacterium]
MISGSLIFLMALVLAIFNWQANLKAKELAFAAAKQLCLENKVDLLDDTVVLHKLKFKNFKLIRLYRFDYHTGTNVRYQGYISISQSEVIDQRLTITADSINKAGPSASNEPAKVLDFSLYKSLKSKNDA